MIDVWSEELFFNDLSNLILVSTRVLVTVFWKVNDAFFFGLEVPNALLEIWKVHGAKTINKYYKFEESISDFNNCQTSI